MDEQRADGRPSDGRGWYGEEHYGEPGRYGGLNEDRYNQPDGFNPYGEETSGQQPFGSTDRRSRPRRGKRSGLVIPEAPGQYDERGFGDSEYAETQYSENPYPDPQLQEPQYAEPTAYGDGTYGSGGDFADQIADEQVRLSARDRQQLRERAAQTNPALASGPIATPVVPAQAGPVSGSPIPGAPSALAAPTAAIPAGANTAPASTYRSRRPGLAVILALGAVVAELILLKVLLGNVFHSGASAVAGTLGALFALAGVPMTIIGLYALATGAATASGPHPGRAWLKTPLAYLPIGLILIVAAGLAA